MTRALAAAYADPKKPYGDVTYADPGYQKDQKKRYPLDSEEHCRAAWSYINMPKNAAKYSPEDLAKVKARIKAALKRYGVEVNASAGPDLHGVELARPGPWKLSTGQTEFTAQNLRDAADFFAASGGQALPIKLGHHDQRFDGEPTFGLVTNVRYVEDERGPVLLGDINGMPGWLAAAAPSRWPNRSIEGWQNVEFDGRDYSLTLSGLVFLGATPPGVRNIRSLSDLQTALAASSATRVFATATDDDAAAPPEPDEPEEPSEQDTPDPALEAAEPPERKKETGMDPAKFREKLGLTDDLSDDEVMAALAHAGFVPQTAEAPVEAEPVPVAASAATPPPGTIVLASSVWAETQNTIKTLTDHVAKVKRNERDEVIAQAVRAGKLTPADKPHFSKMWDADPEAARAWIDVITPNSRLAVMASGYAGEAEEDGDAEYRALFGDPAGKVG